MKLPIITKLLTITALAASSVAIADQPSQARGTTFYCGISAGIPTTMAQTPRGNVPIIRWVSRHFNNSGYSPTVRCQEVSKRFQTYYNQRILNYITTGYMNNQPVVCVTSTNGGPCSRLLFTLKPGQNASRTLQQLFDIRQGAAGPLYENTSTAGGNQNLYIDMNNYLETAPVETGATSPDTSSTETPQNTPAPVSNDESSGVW
ncbi:MAG: COP23 domain-containing protein [Cyanobacteria bacterium P01_G01_bin.49]